MEVLAKLKALPSVCCSLDIIEQLPVTDLQPQPDITSSSYANSSSSNSGSNANNNNNHQQALVSSILSKTSSSSSSTFSDERIVVVTQERSIYVWDNFTYEFLYYLPPAPVHYSASIHHAHQEQQAFQENVFNCAMYVPELEKLFAAGHRISSFDYVRYV